MGFKKSTKASADQPNPSKLIRSQFNDVMVKVEDDVYYLDRLRLALKSGYFEKLFAEGESDLIEIPQMDSKTFSAAVDIIYGESFRSVMKANSKNFVSLLMAMDYLHMDIDTETCEYFVAKKLDHWRPFNKDTFKLYNFIADNAKYEYLLPAVFKHLSACLEELKDRDELLSIKPDHFAEIIACRDWFRIEGLDKKFHLFRIISEICARWICHDLENRLQHALELKNAARCRFYLSDMIAPPHEESDLLVYSIKNRDMEMDQYLISRYFCKWLMYFGEIRRSEPVAAKTSGNEYREDKKTDEKSDVERDEKREEESDDESDEECYEESDGESFEESDKERIKKRGQYDPPYALSSEPKLKTFLKNNDYYDITVKAGEKMYKLHRSVLKSESLYFNELFSREFTQLSARFEGIPTLPSPSKDDIYTIDDVDSTTFDLVVDHLYSGNVEPSQETALPLLKAAHLLKINSLKEFCSSWMKKNYDQINAKDLFKAIALSEGADSCENGVYLFDKVDQETFKTIIDYLYFNKKKLQENNLARVLRASDMFKIKKLTEECVKRLLRCPKKMSPADVKEVLNVTLKNVEYYDVLNTVYLAEHMNQWPQIDIDLFCTISFDCLENMLISHNLHFDDPRVLPDICSKWVMHDVENRYCFIPRIAVAINRNFGAICDDYYFWDPPGKECSQDYVRELILEMSATLSTHIILPWYSSSENEIKKRKTELPVFITSNEERSFSVLNADWDEIVSLNLGEYIEKENGRIYEYSIYRYPMSATINKDNLFILCCVDYIPFFYVYNLPSDKIFSLATDPRIVRSHEGCIHSKYTLLNCCNDIYCCHEDGQVLKYFVEFNRWMKISAPEPDKYGIRFASDGNKLFRMIEMERTNTEIEYNVQVYDFEQNSWISMLLPSLTRRHELYEKSGRYLDFLEFVYLNNYGFAAIFKGCSFILDRDASIWKEINSLPYDSVWAPGHRDREIINQNQADEMLYVCNNKLYKFFPANESWKLRKEWPMKTAKEFPNSGVKIPTYGGIIGIHNPKPNSNLLSVRGFTTLAPSSRSLYTRAVRLGGQLRGSHFQSAPVRALVSLGLLASSFF